MKNVLLGTTCFAVIAMMAQPAFAQEAPHPDAQQPENVIGQPALENEEIGAPTPGAASAPQEQPAGGIEEIVVTAQRRAENLQRAAIAVTALTGDALVASGITRPGELGALVPSLQAAANAGPFNLFYLRGVGNFNANAFSDAAVAFNVDGVFLGRPSSTTGFFYDLERVEVVKGPQGTLYGRNATGGAINVITKKPQLNEFSWNAMAEIGNYDQLRLDAAVNVPLGDLAAVRVAGFRVRHDGYMNDGTDDQDDWGARASLRLDPSDDLRITVVADYYDQGGAGPGSTPLLHVEGVPIANTLDPDDRIGFLSPQGQAVYTSLNAGPLRRTFRPVPASLPPFLDNQFWGVSSTIDWETSLGTLTVIPGYREGKLNYRSYTPGFFIQQRENQSQTTLEARFATTEDYPLRAIIGAFYYDENIEDPEAGFVHQANGQWPKNLDLDTKSTALFGRLVYAVTDDIRINVGARQTWESKRAVGDALTLTRICTAPVCTDVPQLPYTAVQPTPMGGPTFFDLPTPLTTDNEKDFNKFTWRVGADWDITPRNLLYASYETGFKAGGFFFSVPDAQGQGGVFEPETIKAFTLGSKNRFFNNVLQVNAELFYWRYRDQQISQLTNVAGIPVFATLNAGRATFKGAEIETTLLATPTTRLTADVQYLDAVYDSYVIGSPAAGGFPLSGCPTTGPASGNFQIDCSGYRPPNAPKWSMNFGVEQTIPVSFGEFVVNARAHYQTETLTGLQFVPLQYQDNYWTADAQVTWFSPQRTYFVTAFVNNMFDETIVSQSFATPYASIVGPAGPVQESGLLSSALRPPRTYGLRVGVDF